MAGNYVSIEKDSDWRNGDGNKMEWVGRTHGCDCCSSWETLTPDMVRAHIRYLYEDIAKANEVLKDMGEGPEGPPA